MKCFGKDGKIASEELISFMKKENILKDFLLPLRK